MDGTSGAGADVDILRGGSGGCGCVGGEFFAHGFHLSEGVLVSGAVGGGDAGVEAGEGGFSAAELHHRLRGHLVRGDVVGGVADEDVKLSERGLGVATRDMFHGEAVAGEGVGGIELEDFIERGEFVHGSILRGATGEKLNTDCTDKSKAI